MERGSCSPPPSGEPSIFCSLIFCFWDDENGFSHRELLSSLFWGWGRDFSWDNSEKWERMLPLPKRNQGPRTPGNKTLGIKLSKRMATETWKQMNNLKLYFVLVTISLMLSAIFNKGDGWIPGCYSIQSVRFGRKISLVSILFLSYHALCFLYFVYIIEYKVNCNILYCTRHYLVLVLVFNILC